jgi:hypothetical protein
MFANSWPVTNKSAAGYCSFSQFAAILATAGSRSEIEPAKGAKERVPNSIKEKLT